ncbi:MAG: family 10 glycosylhydrolase [Treponema sp.]|nr:family 10 glycosylhydrolase [Treponema sp.]
MRKIFPLRFLARAFAPATLAIALSTCGTPPPPQPAVDEGLEALYRFARRADGSHGYDPERPVFQSLFSDRAVELPRSVAPAKREFRGAWVATVHNLDMPAAPTRERFERDFLDILDVLGEWNMNALIFQVRPALDAFYPSEINPWSEFLTGRQGDPPLWGADWDPLEWMIARARERGMEFHAWLNPYRVTATSYLSQTMIRGMTAGAISAMSVEDFVEALARAGVLSLDNFAARNPQYVYRFNGRLSLDPGFPAVRQHVVDTVMEIIRRYDVDAIHFDDYFYPYRAGAQLFGAAGEDRRAFELYGLGRFPDSPAGIAAWRRENNTALMREVAEAIAAENRRGGRAVQFGVSPFGIWEHAQNDPRGSATPAGSGQTYSTQVFADTRLWASEGLVDYIIPQIYWSFDQGAAPYAELASWWAEAARGSRTSLYIGHAQYKHLDNAATEPAWMNPEEIYNQLRYNRLYPEIAGSAFFRFERLLPVAERAGPGARAHNEAIEILRGHYGRNIALPPAKPWLMPEPPEPPRSVALRGATVSWSDVTENNARLYVVYRAPESELRRAGADAIIADPRNIVGVVARSGNSGVFVDPAPPGRGSPRQAYVVTALNAAQVESRPTATR